MDRKPYNQYPLRTCMTMHECQICGQRIDIGEEYYDGGLSRRVHKVCFDEQQKRMKE